MESSPLTQAHIHARNAVTETRKSNPVAASEEHDLAAGEFAHTAQLTEDPEALRTLKLLEEHHKKLAHILKFRNDHPEIPKAAEPPFSSPTPSTPDSPTTQKTSPSTVELPSVPPRLSHQNRLAHRDSTPSIASNLASARGIPAGQQRRGAPASPTLSAQHAGGKMHIGTSRAIAGESKAGRGSLPGNATEKLNQSGLSKIGIPSPVLPPSRGVQQTDIASSPVEQQASVSDEPFQRFYSTFEGLISKLSAPLAFAGLPLSNPGVTSESVGHKAVLDPKPSPQTSSLSNAQSQDPDLTKIISRAALRAVKDTNSPGSFGYNAAESFYVVPTTGGTISYAGILTRAEQESLRQKQNIVEAGEPAPFFRELGNDEDETGSNGDGDFVDARETPTHHSPEINQNRHGRSKSGGPTVGGKTMEELHLENTALKHLSDTLSKRLHMWEVNAQSSSAALQQSLRAMQHAPSSPRVAPQDAGAKDIVDDDALRQLRELEEQMQKTELEKERVARENEKLKLVVGRYRERWEKLKEGARTRREGSGNGATPSLGGGKDREDDI